MQHNEYRRYLSNSNTVALFIHGILGTPNHFNSFIPLLPKRWSVCNLLLEGHGKGVGDFGEATMADWKKQVDAEVANLSKLYDNIIIIAHSMGTLFAINLSIKYPNVRGLFLLAPPLKPIVKPPIIKSSIKLLYSDLSDDDPMKNAYSIQLEKNLFKYLSWVPNYMDLLREIGATKKAVDKIAVPCWAFTSKHDELVLASTINYFEGNNMIRSFLLEESGHFSYSEKDYDYLIDNFKLFCVTWEL
ncbi:MAG: hypothetical protein ATN35_03235 [Epulopiscium sp. Nele67-Bin004]|nr:MAG: hypothetical protein ATN35_03235 [Epulopiscium sp. Nele67-Bin004]